LTISNYKFRQVSKSHSSFGLTQKKQKLKTYSILIAPLIISIPKTSTNSLLRASNMSLFLNGYESALLKWKRSDHPCLQLSPLIKCILNALFSIFNFVMQSAVPINIF